MKDVLIRTIEAGDDKDLATIVRSVLAEFGANRPGTVYYDKTTDNLFELFQQERAVYYVAFIANEMVGGAGIFPSAGLPENTGELVKMYLKPHARGSGLGKLLIERCLSFAGSNGYRQVYIETMPELKKAMSVYEKFGFRYLSGPMGNTGHFGCEIWMLKDLRQKETD
jgi:putative acetyltransferase